MMLLRLSRHIVSLPNWCLRLCVWDQTVGGWRYFTEPGVLEGQCVCMANWWSVNNSDLAWQHTRPPRHRDACCHWRFIDENLDGFICCSLSDKCLCHEAFIAFNLPSCCFFACSMHPSCVLLQTHSSRGQQTTRWLLVERVMEFDPPMIRNKVIALCLASCV